MYNVSSGPEDVVFRAAKIAQLVLREAGSLEAFRALSDIQGLDPRVAATLVEDSEFRSQVLERGPHPDIP